MKTLEELLEVDDPAMPFIQTLLDQAERPYELLPPSSDNASVLLRLQVTTR